MRKSKFDIQGMTCSSCQAHVEKAVKKLDGIENVNVNLLSNNMVVEFNEKKIDDKTIIDAVVQAGYGATISGDKRENRDNKYKNSNQDDVIKSMKKRLIISIIFLIPLMYIAMHHMLYEWFGLPVPQIVKDLFHGNENRCYFWIYTIFITTSNYICKQKLFYRRV